MLKINPDLFRKNDIRGIAQGINKTLTPEVARLVGQSVGTYLPLKYQTKRVFIGCDNRLSSEDLKNSLISGVRDSGLDVIDIGLSLTPMIYYASATFGSTAAGVMITGSHLPVEHNGIKIVHGNLAVSSDDIMSILEIIHKDGFKTKSLSNVTRNEEIKKTYFAELKNKVKIHKKISVVIDAGNALSGIFVPQLLDELSITVHKLYCNLDGNYPNHLPNPEITDYMKDLGAEVKKMNADIGIAFDGDADRFGVVDNEGNHVSSDRLIIPIAAEFLERNPGATIVLDVKTSQVVYDRIRSLGGNPVMWMTGHSLTMLKMSELGSLLGSDAHGHLYFGENYYGFDDGVLGALKLLEVISKTKRSVFEIFNDIPTLHTSPEIILRVPDNQKFRLVEIVKEELKNKYNIIEIDGARAMFENGWGLIRASNSQAAITLKFEAYTKTQLKSYSEIFLNILTNNFNDLDITPLLAQIGKVD